MPRNPRTILEGFDLVEVTNRTVHSRFLLRPCPKLTAIIHGAIGRAQRKYGVEVYGYVFLSNHYHLLIKPADSLKMARFVAYFQSKIAKEVGRLYGWKDKLWSRRFKHVPVTSEEIDQVARLRYLLENGCKEELVSSPIQWPGASTALALLNGEMAVAGVWPDRTAEWSARQKGKTYPAGEFQDTETVQLSQLPCWKHLDPESYRERVAQMIHLIEHQTCERHRVNNTKPLGVRRIRRHHPHAKPRKTKRSPKPNVHALQRALQRKYKIAHRQFVLAYRSAVTNLRLGILDVAFPPGCFPPGRPFVPH